MKRFKNILWGFLALVMVWGCERDYMFRGGTEGIAFSMDTVMFDTIFTSIGSATRHFRVYNPYGSDMTIDGIRLAGGEDSKFRINVNGLPEHQVDDVPLRTGDSLFVFVEVTINPDANSDPSFVVTDSILFYTKERIQSVKLVAYGQDVVVMRKDSIESQTFTSEKPYLIYDWLMVGEGATLTVEAGARLHFYKGASLIVHNDASLIVNGTHENPVVFTGSRLEEWYADKPGQWGSIWLLPGSRNHSITYADIRNATYGLRVDSVGLNGEEPLRLSNTRIEHITKQGLVAQSSSIVAHNSLFADCGSASVALTLGGNYEFYHCTIANYYRWSYRGIPALLLSNYFMNEEERPVIMDMESALFSNCIIYGSNENEIGLDFEPKADRKDSEEDKKEFLLNYKFEHSLIKTTFSDDALSNRNHFDNVIVNQNPSFMDFSAYNYRLDTLSVAQDAGSTEIARQFPFDYMGNKRVDALILPDLGFLERIEIEQE
ncbi:hypothetical protein [Geofilum rubicundum]|uniref:Right handed beta helix domain-containing protein n=1 Tax=Geofilum rubicundum JCM 15548 TaxID=1236989 RepID=A0A0E9M3N1_9BACT|nr:hypothetical protein [Geofilum rubicundum]GAO31800.1 hypothetical protein JCM15548_14198 [Geofilum rubicundum JCM 15548]